MAVLALKQVETQQDASILQARLQKETSEVKNPYKGKVIEFMVSEDMETIADLDYPARVRFEKWLPDHTDSAEYRHYLVSFDRIKQYSVSKEIHIAADGKPVRPNYENTILFLLYHPNPDIRAMFRKATKKHELAWDFTRAVPEKLKRQIFDILHYALENDTAFETRRKHLLGLRELYDFCADEKIDDIEQMELAQEQQFKGLDSERLKPCNRVGIISFCRKALFMQTEKINWNAHVWYMERFQIQPERLDVASPVSSISFTEVTHKKNRELLKKYIRYGLGITNLSVSVIRGEHSAIRNFLNDICQDENEDVCSVTPAQMDDYFKKQRQRSVQAETYNKNVMCIQHFFNFLKVRQYIERIPFDAECCLKKIIPRHLDRSVAQEAADEILEKLCCFPETIRIMYLHLWGVGLRISEVCTLKGNAYYIQGKEWFDGTKQDEKFGIGQNGEILSVQFGLYAAEDITAADGMAIPKDGLIEIASCDENGKAVFATDLPVGAKLYVKEYSTDEHYLISDEIYPVEFAYAGQETAVVNISVNDGQPMENKLIRGSVIGKKIDEDGFAICGAIFGLFKADETEFTEDTAILTAESNEIGVFGFENVPFGNWIIRELKAAPAFVLNETTYPVTISENEEIVEIEIENRFIVGSVQTTKVDAQQK